MTPLLLILLSLISITSFAQSFEFFPGAKYDPAIPTLKQVAGHDWGERITMHHEMERYVNALQQSAPARAKLFRYGETWEGKSLYYLVIGSPQNIARLDEIKADMQKLADPRRISSSEANSIISSMPAVVWLAYSVHGNEISSTDAALLTAYHLLAAQSDAIVEAGMKDTLVIIDPMQNPDGRDRFINYFRQTMGRWPDADTQSAEHNEVWPSGRVNHYLFDMNRDWFAQSQPETQGRAKAYLEWFPQVFVDLHEMGSNSSYYFAPPALPWNPNLTKVQSEWLAKFGRNNAKWFDKFRFDYFTREAYDSFYPGYGEGWPMFHGSIGMTYENASVRGLTVRRSDETTRTYGESVQRHFISSLSTVENAAQNREALLRYFYDYRKLASEEGARETVKEYIITPGSDPNRAAKLAATLMKSGIEVRRADAAFSNPKTRDYFDGQLQPREFPAGSYVVSLAQPAKRLLKTLMDKHTPQDREFIDEQRERNRRRLNEEFYDVTAWSLPFLYDVPCFMAEQASGGNFTTLRQPPLPAGRVHGEKASLAYLIPWGTQSAAAALADLFRQDVRVHSSDKQLRLNGTSFPRGTLIVKTRDNPADLHERMQKLAATHGVDIYPTDSSWVEEGPNFGSGNVNYLPRPRIAMAWNTPTSANSVGWTRYLLEQRYGCPVTVIRAEQLRFSDLTKYNVLILPDSFGGYTAMLGDGAKLKEWVGNGGTLITFANATSWLTEEKVAMLPVKREKREKAGAKGDKDKEKREGAEPGQQPKPEISRSPQAGASPKAQDDTATIEKAIEPADEYPSSTPGAIVRVKVDNTHWLGFGYGDTTTALVDSNRIFSLLKLDQGTNVAIFAPADKMLLSGLMWDDVQKQLPNKAFVMDAPLGRGNIVSFAEDPNYRAFQESMSLMFMNAVLLGPGH
ncbi:MAG TPA: M14 family metallopeptidase [Blastocatellia bacterium]|nr:M14 family metallopeptidase [Blastocatellia bacterium]